VELVPEGSLAADEDDGDDADGESEAIDILAEAVAE
jgi:hypothetical protein